MDSRLTRRVDLRGVADATLDFQAWYDLEDQFDYVYLSASSDNGKTWQILPGRQTTPDRATGNNYGMGWTGSSGSNWIDEEVDLSAFAVLEISGPAATKARPPAIWRSVNALSKRLNPSSTANILHLPKSTRLRR